MMGKGLSLDFEGNLEIGIREIGLVSFSEFILVEAKEFIVTKTTDLKDIFEKDSDYQFIISHNVSIERNLIKKFLPYPICKDGSLRKWGPWLDTVTIYQKLYPNLINYDLKTLVNHFLDQKLLNDLCFKFCKPEKQKYHNALFDALCSYLLVERLAKVIDLKAFLQE